MNFLRRLLVIALVLIDSRRRRRVIHAYPPLINSALMRSLRIKTQIYAESGEAAQWGDHISHNKLLFLLKYEYDN